MKPRIQPYKALSRNMSWVLFRCVGGGVMGLGDTSDHAYWDWRYHVARAARQ